MKFSKKYILVSACVVLAISFVLMACSGRKVASTVVAVAGVTADNVAYVDYHKASDQPKDGAFEAKHFKGIAKILSHNNENKGAIPPEMLKDMLAHLNSKRPVTDEEKTSENFNRQEFSAADYKKSGPTVKILSGIKKTRLAGENKKDKFGGLRGKYVSLGKKGWKRELILYGPDTKRPDKNHPVNVWLDYLKTKKIDYLGEKYVDLEHEHDWKSVNDRHIPDELKVWVLSDDPNAAKWKEWLKSEAKPAVSEKPAATKKPCVKTSIASAADAKSGTAYIRALVQSIMKKAETGKELKQDANTRAEKLGFKAQPDKDLPTALHVFQKAWGCKLVDGTPGPETNPLLKKAEASLEVIEDLGFASIEDFQAKHSKSVEQTGVLDPATSGLVKNVQAEVRRSEVTKTAEEITKDGG